MHKCSINLEIDGGKVVNGYIMYDDNNNDVSYDLNFTNLTRKEIDVTTALIDYLVKFHIEFKELDKIVFKRVE